MQEVAAFVIVVLAAAYVAWKLMPGALRTRLARALADWARRRGRLSDDDAAVLTRRLTAGGCGSCDSCGACGSERPAAPGEGVLRVAPDPSSAERSARGAESSILFGDH